ncbi:MAG: GNAT family N-acetyltransferase [Actinomycetota bacterium]|nr:GNAT family N-acetyltransferase [Actinomycetota bacterium]
MEIGSRLRFRSVRPEDAAAIGRLHADSWRRHYRGAYTDSFLDGHVTDVLTRMWTERLATPLTRADTVLAEDEHGLAGFAHTWFDGDRTWGALLDNLHVRFDLKGRGIGTLLMGLAARAVHDWSASTGLCLWVLEQNVDAQAFYSARGGTCVERGTVPPPVGDPAHLNGRPACLRFVWRDTAPLRQAAERVVRHG